MNKDDASKKLLKDSEQYIVKDNILYHICDPTKKNHNRQTQAYNQVAVPLCLREQVKNAYHDQHGHLGFDKTYFAIKTKYYWPKMYTDIENYVKECKQCQFAGRYYSKHKAPLCPIPVAQHPFHRVHIDIVGPLTENDGYKYLLVIVDALSGWCEAFPLVTQEAAEVTKTFFQNFVCRFGAPSKIVTDMGTNFQSKLLTSLCTLLNIDKLHTSPYHPQSNSVVERTNGTIGASIRKSIQNQDEWLDKLPAVLMGLRNAVSATTGHTPYNVLFGRHMRFPIDNTLLPAEDLPENVKSHVENLEKQIEITDMIVKTNRICQQARQKAQYDKTSKEPTFTVGQQVLLSKEQVKPGESSKLSPKFTGPYQITKLGNNYTYKIKHLPTGKTKDAMVHANRLRPYYEKQTQQQAEIDVDLNLDNQTLDDVAPENPPSQQGQAHHEVDEVERKLDDQGTARIPEKITQHKKQNKKDYYRIKWLGLDHRHNTWEWQCTVPQELLDAFHAKKRKRRQKQKQNKKRVKK